MIIREVTSEECKEILKIEKSCFSDPWSISDFEYQIKSPYSNLIGAFADGQAVGFVNTVCIVDEIEINNIAVLEEYRGNHIADKLLEFALLSIKKQKKLILRSEKAIFLRKSFMKSMVL